MPTAAPAWRSSRQEMWADHVCDAPLRQWSVGNEAHGVLLDDPEEAWRRAHGTLVPVTFDVEWHAIAAPTALDAGLRAGRRDRRPHRADRGCPRPRRTGPAGARVGRAVRARRRTPCRSSTRGGGRRTGAPTVGTSSRCSPRRASGSAAPSADRDVSGKPGAAGRGTPDWAAPWRTSETSWTTSSGSGGRRRRRRSRPPSGLAGRGPCLGVLRRRRRLHRRGGDAARPPRHQAAVHAQAGRFPRRRQAGDPGAPDGRRRARRA